MIVPLNEKAGASTLILEKLVFWQNWSGIYQVLANFVAVTMKIQLLPLKLINGLGTT